MLAMNPFVEFRLPPARIVVKLRHLDEAELLVVVGSDPFPPSMVPFSSAG
jgi:hypothetical protein